MSTPASSALGPDARLADRYRLLEVLGSGGMGRVYRARDELIGRDVAIKLLDTTGDDRGRAALEEARAAAHLTHPGIAKVFDSGTHAGRSFIVMEHVPGRPLDELLRERGTIPPGEAVELAARVADALDHAHRQDVVHCDVKPQNVIVTPEGVPKLVDFGIARAATTSGAEPAEIRGSAPYLSPEQVRGEPISGRTDIYALGVVLYEMLTGRPPFEGASVAAVVSQRLVSDPRPPSSLEPAISPEVERVVLTALARDPAQRYPDARALRDALRGIAAEARAQTRRIEATARLGRPPTPPRATCSWLRSRRVYLPALAGAAALLLVFALLAALLGSPAGRSPAAKEVAVPNLVGKRISEVSVALEQAGLAAGTVRVRLVGGEPSGTVLEQQPAPTQMVPIGGQVDLVVGVQR